MIKLRLWKSANLPDVTDPEPDPHIPPLISTAEAAEILGYTRAMVSILVRDGRLRGRRVGNTWVFRQATVEKYRDEIGRVRAPKR